jgi:RNA polymerase sigma factor (sigma-70 family)
MEATVNENLIIKRCQKGELEGFGVLYDSYIQKIYNFIYYKTFHKELAEDLTSKTFVKALENIERFSFDKGKFSSWLYQIARNTVIDHYRSKKNEFDLADFWGISDNSDFHSQLENQQSIEEVKKYLTKLTKEQQEIVVMRVWDDLSYKEISQILGKSEASCKMVFSRVMKDLRQNLTHILLLVLLIKLIK